MTLADKLVSLRKGAKMHISTLAKELHVSVATVNGWESGTRIHRIENVLEIAYFFGVEPNDLLCWDEYLEQRDMEEEHDPH